MHILACNNTIIIFITILWLLVCLIVINQYRGYPKQLQKKLSGIQLRVTAAKVLSSQCSGIPRHCAYCLWQIMKQLPHSLLCTRALCELCAPLAGVADIYRVMGYYMYMYVHVVAVSVVLPLCWCRCACQT